MDHSGLIMSTEAASQELLHASNPMQGHVLPSHSNNNLNNYVADNAFSVNPIKATNRLDEDRAIQKVLGGGMSPEDIVLCAQAYRSLKKSDFIGWLHAISEIPPDVLLLRIQTVAAGTPVIPRIEWTPAPPVTKHSFPDNTNRCLEVTSKRPRLESPANTPPVTARAVNRSNAIRRPCPGNDRSWRCEDRPRDGREGWSSFRPFRDHFRTKHLNDLRVENGTQAACCFCGHYFHGHGDDLIKHLWDVHMVRHPVHTSPVRYSSGTPEHHSPGTYEHST